MKYHPLIIICGPSGVGKTVMIRRLLREIPTLQPTVTFTTRPKRKGVKATEDKIMRFITPVAFRARIRKRQFVEWALVHGHYYYGTDAVELEKRRARGPVILNIEVQGTKIIKRKIPDAVTIFIVPTPRLAYLRRLKRIRRDDPNLEERIRDIQLELKDASTFDYRVSNREGQLKQTYKTLKTLIRSIVDPVVKLRPAHKVGQIGLISRSSTTWLTSKRDFRIVSETPLLGPIENTGFLSLKIILLKIHSE